MKIRCGDKTIVTYCTGCPCHWDNAIVMGDSFDNGNCRECGCPKTVEAFEEYIKTKSYVSDKPCCTCGAIIFNNHHCANGHMILRN